MSKRLAIFLALFCVLQVSANERSVRQMNCELKNFFGLKVGTVNKTPKDLLQLNYGFLGNQLKIDEVSETEITAIDRDVRFSYSFSTDELMTKSRGVFEGTLYQQYIKGLGGPKVPVAHFKCSMLFKD